MSIKNIQQNTYLNINQLILLIEEPYRTKFIKLLADNKIKFSKSRGSTNNHQAWQGGYLDHIQEAMNISIKLYDSLNILRALPFSKSDALIAIFCHDLEKPWKYEKKQGGYEHRNSFSTKESHQNFRINKLKEYGIELTSEQEAAIRYAEGELADYTNKKRMMGPLGAFCHMCDIASARLWFDYPLKENDPWNGATRNSLENK